MRILLPFVLLFLYSILQAQDTDRISLFDTLYTGKNITINLTYPFDSLHKTNNDEIIASISILMDGHYIMKDEPMSINLRGKFRRMKCAMPPLMLNFKKSTLKQLNLRAVDEMKLVTHCLKGPEGPQNLEEERLLYQVYETLTPMSYRTIWVNVNYCNMADSTECISNVAFLLEPDKVLSSRLGVTEKKVYNVTEDSLHYDSYSLAASYNYLIGNRDWSIISSRNAKLFYNPGMGKYIVIPYDFDYANVVAASYRRETLPKTMEHPFDRIYQGEYYIDQAGNILKSFYGFEQPVLDAINSANNPMDAGRRKRICMYFDEWFDMVKKAKPEDLQYGTVCPYKGGL
ncbi:MAG TPA: hypothetical protein VMZ69_06300 [Saprospiraceae bacterium]|nr:hypothetical protein [Saprospiraceae bacterium]